LNLKTHELLAANREDLATFVAVDDRPLIDPATLAQRLGVSVGTVYGWNEQGTGPPYFRVGKFVRYRVDDVDTWLAARAVPRMKKSRPRVGSGSGSRRHPRLHGKGVTGRS
jgi:excisionase family DNA binding protein